HAVGKDIFLSAVASDRSVQGEHARLRGTILQVVNAVAAMCGAARDVNKDTATALTEMLHRTAAELCRREKVYPHRAIPATKPVVDLESKGVLLINTRVVDKHVDASAPCNGVVPKTLGLGG